MPELLPLLLVENLEPDVTEANMAKRRRQVGAGGAPKS